MIIKVMYASGLLFTLQVMKTIEIRIRTLISSLLMEVHIICTRLVLPCKQGYV